MAVESKAVAIRIHTPLKKLHARCCEFAAFGARRIRFVTQHIALPLTSNDVQFLLSCCSKSEIGFSNDPFSAPSARLGPMLYWAKKLGGRICARILDKKAYV